MTAARAAWWLGLPFRLVLLALLGAYRATVGRFVAGRCRFHPSCSAYAMEAIRVHGAVRGTAMAAWRVLRCSPLTAGGIDPVAPARRATVSHEAEAPAARVEASETASYKELAAR